MLKWIAGGVVAFFAGRYLLRLNKASQSIVARTRLQVHRVSLSGIELTAIIRLQNPNSIGLNIRFPFVNLKHKGTSIGSSQVKDETLQLAGNSEKAFSLRIQSAGWLSLIQALGAAIVQKIRSGQKVPLELLAITSTQVNGIPFEKQETITLQL